MSRFEPCFARFSRRFVLQVDALPTEVWDRPAALPDMGEAEEGSSATCHICLVRACPVWHHLETSAPRAGTGPAAGVTRCFSDPTDPAGRRRTTTWATCFPSCLATTASTRRALGRGSSDGAKKANQEREQNGASGVSAVRWVAVSIRKR